MIVEDSTADAEAPPPPTLYDKALATLHCKEWIDTPLFIPPRYETPEEATAREQLEAEYRAAANPTEWITYMTLGRYTVDGYIFQAVMEDLDVDPLQAHCVIYYNYSYHSDRRMEIPSELKAWTQQYAIPFLEKEKPNALTVDTKRDSWKKYAARLLLPLQWTEAVEKKHKDHTASESTTATTDGVTHPSATKELPIQSPGVSTADVASPFADNNFDFTVSDWVAPPLFVPHRDERTTNRAARQQAEHVYRARTTPTLWNRYLTLARYALIGPDFDSDMEAFDSDPMKVHCVVWYNYMYHTDRNMEVTPKLEAWALQRSEPYLQLEKVSALTVDTISTTWCNYAKKSSLQPNWSYVPASKKTSKKSPAKKQTLLKPYMSAASKSSNTSRFQKPATIMEEQSKEDSSRSSTPGGSINRIPARDDESDVSDSKMSALLPNLHVPVCDGTYRVTLRWKVPIEVHNISRQQKEMQKAIYDTLHKLFQDDDGFLYEWSNPGVDRFNLISKMSPTEVSQFTCSHTYIPSQSLVVIPIRYAFSAHTPGKWRNSERTKELLDSLKITVSISNSTSTSGDLVNAGYIMLKAPMNTHRLRYLQSLRKMLPPNTPPFDILLHKRSPTDALIPHLGVQCGEKHAHALSEALMNILTGEKSALYIPRTVFNDMTDDQAKQLFQTHDKYVKGIQWISLSPLLTNLDKPRVEHNSDGTTTERTTREWAREIRSVDGKTSAWCDVVNGGLDQLAYLVFPPSHGEAAYKAFEAYRSKLYPFRQREARYRQKVGTASSTVYNQKVIANLDFMLQISASMDTTSTPKPTTQSETDQSLKSSSSMETELSEKSEQSQSTTEMPRHQDTDQSSQTSDHTATTDTSRDDSDSRLSSDRMSSSSAKFRNIEEVVKRNKQALQKNEQMVTDRFAHIERQVYRMNEEIEKKLEGVQAQVTQQLITFETRMLDTLQSQVEMSGSAMTSMNAKLEKLLLAVEVVLNKEEVNSADQTSVAPNESNAFPSSAVDSPLTPAQTSDNTNLGPATGGPLLPFAGNTPIRSPEKKRQKPAKKKRALNSAIRHHLDHPTSPSSPMSDNTSNSPMMISEDLLTPRDQTPSPPNSFSDLESQYKAKTRQHKDNKRQHTGESSPSRKDQK
jgi:hypothetical protein